jgi:hypothetical protein
MFRWGIYQLQGKIARITRRATVMTSQGKFYVPLAQLTKLSK